MKKIYLILLLAISLSACKKDALKVESDKTYVEQGVSSGSGSLGFGGVILKLMPDGNADILVGGDAFSRTTYKIKGDKLTIGDNEEFKIISETELRYQNTRVLKLEVK